MKELRDNGTYLGFWKDKEYYYRFGEIITFKIGSFLLALTDVNVDDFETELARIDTEVLTMLISESQYRPEAFAEFSELIKRTYKYLDSLSIVLGDSFCFCIANTVKNELQSLQSLVCPDNDAYTSTAKKTRINKKFNALLSLMFNDNNMSISSFNIAGLSYFFSNFNNIYDKTDVPIAFKIIHECLQLIKHINMIRFGLLQIIPVTLMRDASDVPALKKYEAILDGLHLYNENKPDSASLLSDSERSIYQAIESLKFGHDRLISAVSKIIRTEPEDKYDALQGRRLILASNTTDLLNTVCSEFEFLCANNIDIVKCKNCGRYFLPLTSASSFCDRPLEEDPTRICKSLSSQWYADNKRSNNPAWDEYMVYRSRYNSRTYRNKAKNPKDRLDRWNKHARQLFQDYDSGKITHEEFSSTLAEMDKDMKPLDEM